MIRADFVQRWHNRARQSEDCFDQFFAGSIALVTKARGHADAHQLSQPDTDRIATIHYCESRAKLVVAVLNNLPADVKWLAQRKGTDTGEAVLDVQPYSQQHLRKVFDLLAQVWAGQISRKPRWIAYATAEMINHIRNNMFHGARDPDDVADRELLGRVNPVLFGILDSDP